jgi:hypothetical protein
MKELAAMTADKELAERERDVAKCDTALERTGRIYAESAKELAERQVAVLIKHASNHSSCFGCKVRDVHRVCQHSDASCFERFAAWSHKQASKQVTNA